MCVLEKLSAANFTEELWEASSYLKLFGFHVRLEQLNAQKAKVLREHAVGYIHGENLWIRPKKDCIAIMYYYDGIYFWSHLSNDEFYKIFEGD